MSLIPDEFLKKQEKINFAPMVDFLFLIVAMLMSFLIAHTALYDYRIHLANSTSHLSSETHFSSSPHFVVLRIDSQGKYAWISDRNETVMSTSEAIEQELKRQHLEGILPQYNDVKVLVYIDRHAQWESIADLFAAVKRAGFSSYPVYRAKY